MNDSAPAITRFAAFKRVLSDAVGTARENAARRSGRFSVIEAERRRAQCRAEFDARVEALVRERQTALAFTPAIDAQEHADRISALPPSAQAEVAAAYHAYRVAYLAWCHDGKDKQKAAEDVANQIFSANPALGALYRTPFGPKYDAARAALSDAERDLYDVATKGVTDSINGWETRKSNEAAKVARDSAEAAYLKTYDDARIAALPTFARLWAKVRRKLLLAAKILEITIVICLLLLMFIWGWVKIAALALVILPFYVPYHWRESLAVIKAFPTALRALLGPS